MSKKMEWREDSEVMGIALQVVEHYSEIFDGLDLGKLRFLRILDKKSPKEIEVKSVGFPFIIDNPYVYYLMVNNMRWKMLSTEQRQLAVFRALYTISPGGTDESSTGYGRKRKRDIEDYSVVLGAAGGRYDWNLVGASELPSILGDGVTDGTGGLDVMKSLDGSDNG